MTSTWLAPETTDLEAIVEEVWASFVGADEPLHHRAVAPAPPLDADLWSGAVTVTGDWRAAVTVELAAPIATMITRVMLDLGEPAVPADGPSDDDVADAVGELVNMIGGNVKSLMPGHSTLSLPAVAAGRAVFASDAVEVARLDLLWAGFPVRVTVHCPRS